MIILLLSRANLAFTSALADGPSCPIQVTQLVIAVPQLEVECSKTVTSLKTLVDQLIIMRMPLSQNYLTTLKHDCQVVVCKENSATRSDQ